MGRSDIYEDLAGEDPAGEYLVSKSPNFRPMTGNKSDSSALRGKEQTGVVNQA